MTGPKPATVNGADAARLKDQQPTEECPESAAAPVDPDMLALAAAIAKRRAR